MTQLASDNFNRADGTLGPNWTQSVHNTTFAISTNRFTQSVLGAGSNYFWNAIAWPNDQWSQILVAVPWTLLPGGAGGGLDVDVRASGVTTVTSNGYLFRVFTITTNSRLLDKDVNGVFTQLATDAGAAAAGDINYLEAQGTTIVAKVNGVQVFSVTDSAVASGSAGIGGHMPGTLQFGDNWAGGDFSIAGSTGGWVNRHRHLVNKR